MKSLRHFKNYQTVTQRKEMSKCCRKNDNGGLDRHRVTTNPGFVKNTVSTKCNRAKPMLQKGLKFHLEWNLINAKKVQNAMRDITWEERAKFSREEGRHLGTQLGKAKRKENFVKKNAFSQKLVKHEVETGQKPFMEKATVDFY